MALYPPLPDLTFQCQKQSEIWVRDQPSLGAREAKETILISILTPDRPSFVNDTGGKTRGERAK